MKNAIKLKLFALICGLSGCGIQNSVMLDSALYGPSSIGTQTPSFQKARQVLLSSCVQCHSKWIDFSEQDFKNALEGDDALVVAGSPSESDLYERLRGVNSGGDMPPYRQLEDGDIQAIRDWITQLQ